jgi:Spy/CpxP family protein refolding chaperone
MIRKRSLLGLAPALFLLAAACAGGSPQPTSPAATSDVAPAGTALGAAEQQDESMADLTDHDRHHHHGGFAMFVAMSLDSLGTTPEQQSAIAKIQSDMRAKVLPAHEAEKALLSTLADGVAAGNVDQAKVDAAIAQVSTASAGVHDAVADSLNQLHATLTPSQRVALVDKVESNFEVWHESNPADEPPAGDARGGHLAKLAKDLALSPDQVEKIRASFTSSVGRVPAGFDAKQADAHMKAFAAAFEGDNFDAKTLTTGGPANAYVATWGATRMARFYEAVAPVLTPDQRAKLADGLRWHASYTPTPAN